MNPKKSEKGVSDMDVLNDIRGLLSVAHDKKSSPKASVSADSGLQDKIAKLEVQLQEYKALAKKLQSELNNVKASNEELAAKLKIASNEQEKALATPVGAGALRMDIEGLEGRVAELSATVAQTEDLLRMKTQELYKRIARIFQEGGQDQAALEFRKGVSGLEVAENFARFLHVLIGQ
jgi:chromosome segregation ATPase